MEVGSLKKVIRTPDFPIVETKQGKLHGFKVDDVFHFHGIRYGTAERFELPKAEAPWEGVRDAKAYGYACPLMPENMAAQVSVTHDPGDVKNPMAAPFSSLEMPHVYWPMDEQCLYLNVWTKSIDATAKKPVMVWLHGGGYSAGSAVEIPAYDGHNLADYGDVVIVNLNHRLNCVGFLDLSSFGDEFKYSGIAGMADIVLALRWVHENIAAFGGDPENVTVAGQSGGGGKSTNLMQMPPADGLYRRVISESGALRNRPGMTLAQEKRRWQLLGEKTAELLGLTGETISEIRSISYEKLSKAAEDAGKLLKMPGGLMLFEPSPTEDWFEGLYSTVGFRDEVKDVPVMAGTVLGEFNFMHYLGDKNAYSEEEKRALIEKTFGEDTDLALELFGRSYPGMDPLYVLSVDSNFRPNALRFLNARSMTDAAPCWNYQMSCIVPYMGGLAPWHCAEIPYVFRNVDMEPVASTGYEYSERLQDEISDAWLAFMRTGDPSTEKLAWEPYQHDGMQRMIFSEKSHMDASDDRELMELAGSHAPGFM